LIAASVAAQCELTKIVRSNVTVAYLVYLSFILVVDYEKLLQKIKSFFLAKYCHDYLEGILESYKFTISSC
jgi:hypothetical protein